MTMPLGRRKYARVGTTLPARIEDPAGVTWPGKALNLSPLGVKVGADAPLKPGQPVQINLELPDGDPPISVPSVTLRRDPNGFAFAFLDLQPSALDRIRNFVNYLLPRQPLKVLLVEDDRSVSNVFRDFIEEEGHQALPAQSAETALELFEHFYPDAMIVDLYLPGRSGVEFLRLLANQRRLVPSVVISGVASAEEAQECLRLGALDFIKKPVPLMHLKTMLALLEMQVLNWRLTREVSRT